VRDHHRKQPIRNVFADQALKLVPEPGTVRLKRFGVRRCIPIGGVKAMPCGSNASEFVADKRASRP
jgi:hypothetical protein